MDKDTGAFSFKETPVAGSYKVIIKTTDAGGKSFAKEVKINVQKAPPQKPSCVFLGLKMIRGCLPKAFPQK